MLRPMSELSQLDLSRLRQYRTHLFYEGSSTRPEVALIEYQGEKAVLKDFNAGHGGFGFLFGPLLIWREVRALRYLEGVPGIPRLLSRPNRRAVLMQHIDGRTAKAVPKGELGADFFVRMTERINAMHDRGVVHCDLRSGGNTIIDNDGNPYFIDFVSHLRRGGRWNPVGRWVFRQFEIADHIAIIRLKRRLAPGLLTEADQALLDLDKNHPIARSARFVGHGIRRVLQLILGKPRL